MQFSHKATLETLSFLFMLLRKDFSCKVQVVNITVKRILQEEFQNF